MVIWQDERCYAEGEAQFYGRRSMVIWKEERCYMVRRSPVIWKEERCCTVRRSAVIRKEERSYMEKECGYMEGARMYAALH